MAPGTTGAIAGVVNVVHSPEPQWWDIYHHWSRWDAPGDGTVVVVVSANFELKMNLLQLLNSAALDY